jgi:hypothetical protein
MRRTAWSTVFASLLWAITVTPAYCCDDPAAADAVRASIASACPCTAATNHGQYVSCVNRQIRQAVTSGQLPTNCKGAVTRCAARSTCGKKTGFVTCSTCEPGTCANGVCDDGTTACADSSTCPPVLTHCSTKASADLCSGVVGSGSCCDASCPTTTTTLP